MLGCAAGSGYRGQRSMGPFDPGMSGVAISGVDVSSTGGNEAGVRLAAEALIGVFMSSLRCCLENSSD